MRTNEIKNEIYETEKWEDKIIREDLKYNAKSYTYDFKQYETISSFGESIYTRKASIVEDQITLLKNLVEFNNKSRQKNKEGKDKKEILMKVHMPFIKVEN